MAFTPPTNPEDSYELSPFGFGPFPRPGESVEVAPPHPEGSGYGGVGYGLSSYGSRWFGRPRINVQGGYGGDPYGLGSYGGVEYTSPYVSSAISISGFEVEVFFSEELDTNNPALTDPTSYSLEAVAGAAPATVLSVHIEKLGSVNLQAGDTIAGVISVILTHTGTTLGGTYRVHATGLTDISGNLIVDVVVPFLARGTPPAMVATIPVPDTGNQVLVTFSQDMLRAADEPGPGPGISDAASYDFAPSVAYPIDLVATNVEHRLNAKEVLLTVKGMTSLDYTLTVGPAFAFGYTPPQVPVNATRVDTGTGTAQVSGSNLVVSRLKNDAFGLEWQDQSGTIVPLVSTMRMDFRYDFSAAVYSPAISLFPLPEVAEVVFQDGPALNGVLIRVTFQYGAGAVEQIRIQSGTFDVTVDATWSGGPHTVSFVRNQKADTVTFLLDDYPLTSTAQANIDGVPETQAGIRFSLLNGGWDLSGVRVQEVRASSSQTVYSQAWNFLHDGTTTFEGSSKLTRDTLLTQRGPLVKGWGDTTPATKQDVQVLVNAVEVEIEEVNPYIGAVKVAIPIPLLPLGDPQADVKVDYQWFKSPVMELTGLNTDGLVLNKYDCPRRGHHDAEGRGGEGWGDQIQVRPPSNPGGGSRSLRNGISIGGGGISNGGGDVGEPHLKGAVDIHRFPMGVVLGPMDRAKPIYIGHRYMGFERAYSALINSPTTLLLNQAPGRASVPGFERTVQGTVVAYEGLVKPVDATPAWARSGTDYGGVDHNALTGLDLGTYTVIDAKVGPYTPGDPQGVVYHRGVDLTFPSSVNLVARFQVAASALFDASHPSPGGVPTAPVTDGVFTGVGFGIHDNLKLYFCGVLRVNGVEHVGLLLDPKRPHEVTSWTLGPRSILTASKQNLGTFPTVQVPIGFVAGSRFQVLTGTQVGVYTARSVVAQTNGTTTVEFTPNLPAKWDLYGNKYPEVVFETRVTAKPFTYRLDIDTAAKVAELRISGETQGVVVSLSGDVPALPVPAATSLLLPVDGLGQVFWGSLSRQAASRATWSFCRYGLTPDQVFLQGHAVVVNTEMGALPELDPQARWFPRQYFGYTTIPQNVDELVLKTGVADSSLDFTFGYSRIEPFLSPDALFDIRAKVSLDSGILGSGDIEVSFDDTQKVARVVPLLYQEGFSGEATYRRLVNLPSVSMTGFTLPPTLGWTAVRGVALSAVVQGNQLVTTQHATSRGGWTKNLDWAGTTNAPLTDEGRVFEARLAVTAFTATAAGDTGIRFGCQMPVLLGNGVVQVELRAGAVPGVRLRTAAALVAEYDFDWTDKAPHTYRVLADRNAATVTLVVDDAVQLPAAAMGLFSGGVSSIEGFFGCYGLDGNNILDETLTSTVEWHHFHVHVAPPSTAKRTLGVWLGGDKNDINAFEIPRTDTATQPNSYQHGPVIEEMDWRTALEIRVLRDPGWGVTVYRPDLAPPPYYEPEDGQAGHGFITDTTEPSAGWINVEYQNLPRSTGTSLGLVSFGSLDSRSLSQSRWDWVRYRLFKHPTEDRIAPEHMLLNQFNVITSGELTRDTGLEQVAVVTLDKTRATLLPTHLYAKNIYKVIDGNTVWTKEDMTFDPISQTLTLQQNPMTGEVKEFSSEHATVQVYFIPGHPVTNTYLLNQPLLDGVTKLNEGTPPVPKSQTAESEIEVVFGSFLNTPEDVLNDSPAFVLNDPYRTLRHKDVEGSLYEALDFFEVDDGGQTGLIALICEGGPGTGFSGLSASEGEDIYSPTGGGDPLGGTGHVANHFTTGDKVGKAVGAEVFDFSGTQFWQEANFPASPNWDQKAGSLGGILFASGGKFVNPVVDANGVTLPGVWTAAGGHLGPGTAVLWPSFPARGPVGGDQGRIYKQTDWYIDIRPSTGGSAGSAGGAGLNPVEDFNLSEADAVPPSLPAGWDPNPGQAPFPLGAAFGQMQYAGQYSRVGPWGGLGTLTPDRDFGTFRVVTPVDGHVVRIWDPLLGAWVTFTAKNVPMAATDFAVAPTPHIALAAAINAYPFLTSLEAQAGLTLSGQLMVRVQALDPVDTILNPVYLQTPSPLGFVLADVVFLPGNIGLLTSGSGMSQSSLVAGGTSLGAVTVPPNLLRGMVAQGGSVLPQVAQVNLTFHAV